MKKLFIFLLLGIFFVSFASAESLGTFARNSSVNLIYICDNCTAVNLTSVTYPNSSYALVGQFSTTKNGTNYNHTFSKTESLGIYSYSMCGDLNGILTCSNSDFRITPNGRSFDTGQAVSSFGIIIGVIILSFFFLFLGLRLGQTEKLIPMGFLFVCISLILVIYSFFLSFIFSQDIVQYQQLSRTAEVIFVTILWIIVGAFIVFIALMLIAFIKEIREVGEKRKFGDDWDPINQSYQ